MWSGGANAVAAYKRDLEPLLMYVDVVYGEGAVASFARPMTEDEVSTESTKAVSPTGLSRHTNIDRRVDPATPRLS